MRQITIGISVFTAFLGLSGCSVMEPFSTHGQTSVGLLPYTQTLTLNGDSKHLVQSKVKLAKFINELPSEILDQVFTMKLYSGEGILLQGFARQHLISAGVSMHQIHSQDLSMNYDPSRSYDFSLEVINYSAKTNECVKTRVGNFYHAGNGCSVEAARMQSLVNSKAMRSSASNNSKS